jgi:arylsulfatase A-like enzyme
VDKPNVLFVLCDQMKATASHLYGNPDCRTRNLEALSDVGVRFDQAHTPHPLCVPARASMMTGQFPHNHGARRNETLLGPGSEHLFRIWKEHGYRTGLIGKNHCFQQADKDAYFDVWCEISHNGFPEGAEPKGMEWRRAPSEVEQAHAVRKNMPLQTDHFGYAVTEFPLEDYSTGLVAGQTVQFLEEHGDEPFALWVSFPDPHTPLEAPAHYAQQFAPDSLTLPPWRAEEFDGNSPERNVVLHRILGIQDDNTWQVRQALGVYYAMVSFIDDALGRITESLSVLGLRENTIVVFTSDHGDFAGEHMMINKGGLFYDCLTRVPLIVSWPGHVPEETVDDSMVNLVDIPPTLLSLQGIELPKSMDGAPLPSVTNASPREATFAEYGAGGPPFTVQDLERLDTALGLPALMGSLQSREAEGRRKMVRTREWKYVHDPMGDADELYHLPSDPWELKNLSDDPTMAGTIVELSRKLMDWSILTEDAVAVPLPGEHA